MLSESKIREAGFIRNSSSKKIIYNSKQYRRQSSSDSFSSFQYEREDKPSIISYQKRVFDNQTLEVSRKDKEQFINNQSREKKVISKPLTPQIPKPVKKIPSNQPQFQNQKLKNNFFQQNHSFKANEQQKPLQRPFPRTNTPQFSHFESQNFKNDIQTVQNICNNIGNMKLQGNFSFNPKMQKFKTVNLDLEDKKQQQYRLKEDFNQKKQSPYKAQIMKLNQPLNKPNKQNNYFNETQKFQYDFQASSSSDVNDVSSQDQEDNQAMRFYQQQRKSRQQSELRKTVQKHAMPGKISTHQLPKHVTRNTTNNNNNKSRQSIQANYPKKIQNEEQNDEELIVQYSKKDFVPKIKPDSRTKRQLVQNNSYRNQGQLQPEEVFQTNGGVCFDVDVKQFSQNPSTIQTNTMKKPQKGKKKNPQVERQQMLRRRQTAKMYSQHARYRIFGCS